MTTLFREDMGGLPVTTAGGIHIALASVSSLLIVLSSFVYAVAFRRDPAWRPIAWFSVVIGIGFAVLGPLAAYATAEGSELAGLAERGPLGLYVAWVLVVGLFAVRLGRRGLTGGVYQALGRNQR